MDLTFLPPLVAGALLTFVVSLVTSAVNRSAERKRRKEDRDMVVTDRKDELGRESAQRLLRDLLKMQDTTVLGKFPGLEDEFEFDFDEDQRRQAVVDNVLVTEPAVRKAVDLGLSVLPALFAGMPDLDDYPFVAQREVLNDMVRLVSAYIRGDDIPVEPIGRIEKRRKIVEDYFALQEEQETEEK
jgi:hypothetical protein